MNDRMILAINPGSTSTKIAIYKEEKEFYAETIIHHAWDLKEFKGIMDQYELRKNIIIKKLANRGINLENIDCIVGRGGLVKPIPSGIYTINEAMREDLRANLLGEHASNLGGLLAFDIADSLPKTKAFIADPVVVDELEYIARYSGHPSIQRRSIFHALNQKAVARTYAKDINSKY